MARAVQNVKRGKRPPGIVIVAFLMIVFGLAEVWTAFSHEFFGISTSRAAIFTYSAVAIALCYILAGLLVLAMKKWAAALAILFLAVDIVGRIALVVAGLYPTNTFEQTFAIITGTAIAAIFAIYIVLKWKYFK